MYSVDKSVWVKYIGSCEVPEWYHKKSETKRNERQMEALLAAIGCKRELCIILRE